MTNPINAIVIGQKYRIEEIAAWSTIRGVQIHMDYGGVHALFQNYEEGGASRFVFLTQLMTDPDGVMTAEWWQDDVDAVRAAKHFKNGVYWTNFNSWLEYKQPDLDHAATFELK